MQAQLQFRVLPGAGGRMELLPTEWVARTLHAEVATFIGRCGPTCDPHPLLLLSERMGMSS